MDALETKVRSLRPALCAAKTHVSRAKGHTSQRGRGLQTFIAKSNTA